MTIELRPAQTGDYEYIIARVDHWWGGRNMAAMLPRLFFEHFTPTTAIAVDGESARIAGFVCGFVSQTDPDIAYIHFVGVDPELRGTGVGRTLYEWFFTQAAAQGCTRGEERDLTAERWVTLVSRRPGLRRTLGRGLRRAR